MSVNDPDSSEMLMAVHDVANRRKMELFWIGFLQGALSSGRVSSLERDALEAEARNFSSVFGDRDAYDLAEDLTSKCTAKNGDLSVQLRDMVSWVRQRHVEIVSDLEKDRVNEFLGFCGGVICDGLVHANEAEQMLRMLDDETLGQRPEFRQLATVLREALADAVLSDDEAEDIRDWIARLVGDGYALTGLPALGQAARLPEMITAHDEISFVETRFVITGPLSYGTRSKIKHDTSQVGAEVASSVSKKVHYVVVAYEASKHWRMTHYGGKIEKALTLYESGHPIRFVEEMAFERALIAALERR